MFKPTLAKNFQDHKHKLTYPVAVSVKLDGVRAIFRKGQADDEGGVTTDFHFYTRNNKRWNDEVVMHILGPMREMFSNDKNWVFDGEFFREGWPCQRINGAIAARRKEPSEDTAQIGYRIFDCYLEEKPALSFSSRYGIISSVMYPLDADVREIEHFQADSEEEVMELFSRFVAQGDEGAMVRDLSAPYEHKRTDKLLKVKEFNDDEFECIGMYEGKETDKGSRLVGTMGGIRLRDSQGREFECGSGFNDEQRDYFWNNRDAIVGKQVTVKFFELTPSGIPRFPIYQGVRDYE